MPIDISDLVREVLTNALQGVGGSSDGKSDTTSSNGGRSGLKGLAAGAGAAALAPIALKKLADGLGIDGLEDLMKSPGESLQGAVSQVGDRLTSGAKDKAKEAVGGEGGPGEMVKDAAKGMLPGGGGGGGGGKSGKQDTEGVGKGRRMPIQQSVDVALPVETVYNQWTQFEEWPKFMHRVTRASQEDPCKVNFSVKIWGKTKEFTAEIETQRPNDRIKWKTSQGMNVTGVVAFRELGPNLTRVILSFDVAPGSLVEKYARGARYVKRAARADLHRFVAFIEMLEHETGAWRGVIEEGELVEDHDPSYDEEREYGDADELVHGRGSEEDEDSDDDESDEEDTDEDEEDEEDAPRGRNGGEPRGRGQRRSSQSRQGSRNGQSGGSSRAQSQRSSSRSASRGSSSGRSSSGGSGSGRRSSSGRASGSRKSSGNGSSSGSSQRSSSGSGSRGRSGSSGSRRSSSGTSGRSSGSTSGRSSGSSRSGGSSRGSGGSSGRASSSRSSGSRSSSGRSSGSSSGGSRSPGRSRGASGSSRSSASKGRGESRARSSRR